MKVYVEDSFNNNGEKIEETDRLLPALTEGDEVETLSITPKQHFTQPPPRYSEASLVKVLEELGIGRPSTYAPTIETIQKRGYVTLENRRFVPTELGEIVISLLSEFFPEIIDVEFTAKMENDLDEIEKGRENWVKIIDDFYQKFSVNLDKAEKEMETVEIQDEYAGEDCKRCGAPMVIKWGRFGKFMACSNFPDCRNTKPILKEIGVTCPKCNQGQVVERRTKKRRIFYGCSRYPECDFVSWDKPVPKPCPKCNGVLVEKKAKKQTLIQCMNCDYQETEQE